MYHKNHALEEENNFNILSVSQFESSFLNGVY